MTGFFSEVNYFSDIPPVKKVQWQKKAGIYQQAVHILHKIRFKRKAYIKVSSIAYAYMRVNLVVKYLVYCTDTSIKRATITAQKIKFSIKDFFSVTKSAGNCGSGHIYWRNLQWKTLIFVHWKKISRRFSHHLLLLLLFIQKMKSAMVSRCRALYSKVYLKLPLYMIWKIHPPLLLTFWLNFSHSLTSFQSSQFHQSF